MPKTIYAVLIGINAYKTNTPLAGCINDVITVKSFFEKLALANANELSFDPKFLLAPLNSKAEKTALKNAKLASTDYQKPSKKNILQSFEHFQQAKEGDICLLYYSGHGSFQTAPKEFWHMKSSKQVETLIALDSRTKKGQDIIDKELGYQIWTTMKGKKDVQFLAIMDCCHAGDNTRGEEGVRSREDQPNKNTTPLEKYYGFTAKGNNFYQYRTNEQRIDVPFGTHIHLAAAQESESAREVYMNNQYQGIFTHTLFKTLQNGGMHYSYKELLESVKLVLRNRGELQIPQLGNYGGADARQQFLNTTLQPFMEEYAVSFDKKNKKWLLNAGTINGIYASSKLEKSIVQIVDPKNNVLSDAEITNAKTTTAILKPMTSLTVPLDNQLLKGRIRQLAQPKLKVYLEEQLPMPVQEALTDLIHQSLDVQISTAKEASHIVRPLGTNIILCKKGSRIPVFKRQADPHSFFSGLKTVARWQSFLEKENRSTSIKREEITVELELIEGEIIDPYDKPDLIDTIQANEVVIDPTDVVSLNYQRVDGQDIPPAIRVKVNCKKQDLFVAGFYIDSVFGIYNFLKTKKIKKNEQGEFFRFEFNAREFITIPVHVSSEYQDYGITEITDYLKIFVSTIDFDLTGYVQDPLPLDTIEQLRSPGFERKVVPRNREDWMVITIPIKIVRPLSEDKKILQLSSNQTIPIGTISITAPEGFSAKLTTASKKQATQRLETLKGNRSVTEETNQQLSASLLPPATIWGNALNEDAILSRDTIGSASTQLSILEFEDVKEGTLSEDKPLVLQANDLKNNENIIPFAYDEEAGLYFPVGFTNEQGAILINQLPPKTKGKILTDGAVDKGTIFTSVKLFLKKIIWNPLVGEVELNLLRRCVKQRGQQVVQEVMPEHYLEKDTIQEVALLIHGIIGTTESLVDGFYHYSDLNKQFDEVLTFDYENLNTPIEKTAKNLAEQLTAAGLFKINAPRLTIIAHSMGGLVSRCLIEKLDKKAYIKKLIQLGTPNGGSEFSDFRKSLFSLLTLSMNGVSQLKKFIPFLSHLRKRTSINMFYTLNQMSPTSPFLEELNKKGTELDTSNYYLIGGNTALIEVAHKTADPFWFVFLKALKVKGHYVALSHIVFDDLNNDMAVRTVQMKNIYGSEERVMIVPTDHISYFVEEVALERLKEVILR